MNTLPSKRTCPFSEDQIKSKAYQVRAQFGDGWHLLVPRLRRAVIAEAALYWLGGQAREALDTDWLHETANRLCEVLGVD